MNEGTDKDNDAKTLTEQLEHELGLEAGTALGMEMLWCLGRLIESEDINWIDLMVWRLTREGVAPLPATVQGLAARAAERRLLGESKRGGKPTKVMKEFTERVAHPNAAFLQGALGIGVETAYDIAANSVATEAGHAGKASTVSRGRQKYARDVAVSDLLTAIGAVWAQENPEQLNAMKEYLATITQRDPGKRRGPRATDEAN